MVTLRKLWYALAGLLLLGFAAEQVAVLALIVLLGATMTDLDTGRSIPLMSAVEVAVFNGALLTFAGRIGWELLVRAGWVVPFRKGGRRLYGLAAEPRAHRTGLDRYLHPCIRRAPRSWPANARAYLHGDRR